MSTAISGMTFPENVDPETGQVSLSIPQAIPEDRKRVIKEGLKALHFQYLHHVKQFGHGFIVVDEYKPVQTDLFANPDMASTRENVFEPTVVGEHPPVDGDVFEPIPAFARIRSSHWEASDREEFVEAYLNHMLKSLRDSRLKPVNRYAILNWVAEKIDESDLEKDPFSFQSVCCELGYNADVLRNNLLRMELKDTSWIPNLF